MRKSISLPSICATALCLLASNVPTTRAAVVFQDSFTNFVSDEIWQAHGAGVPDLITATVAVGVDGSSLRMGSSPGTSGEITGIQLAEPFSTTGIWGIRVTARVRPLNQTGAGDGGGSDASAGVAFVGASGAFVRVSAAANRASAPDWADFYADSDGVYNASSVAFAHFPPNDPDGGAEAFRSFVLEINANGTSMTALSSSGQPLAVSPFRVVNPNLTLAAYGDSVNVALFQQRADAEVAPENSFGDIDSVMVETIAAPPAPLIISIAGGGNVIDDSRPSGTRHDGVNYGASWAATNTDSASVTRTGVMEFQDGATNQIAVASSADFNSTVGTIMFWVRSGPSSGDGSEGVILFDRRPRGTNGPAGAVLAQTDEGHIQLQAASGAGIGGFPNEVNDRITLDDAHRGLRMRANDVSGTVFGMELAAPLEIPAEETALDFNLLVQNRSGGAYPARLVLKPVGSNKSLTVSLNEFSGAAPRQMVASGVGGGGAFDQASAEYLHSPYNFYRIVVSVTPAGTTVDLVSEDSSAVFHTFTIPEMTLADFAGSPLQVYILQAANTAAGATEALVDNFTVNSTSAGVLLDDPFEPAGAGPGANWVAATGDGLANQFQSTKSISDNRWHQVALVYDQSPGGALSLFIDGALDSSQTNAQAWAWSDRQIELGRSHEPYWQAFNGAMDDFRIYNRTLTPSEIADAHTTGSVVDSAALMVRLNFDRPPSGYTLTWPGNATLETTADFTEPVIWAPVPNSRPPFYIRPNDEPLRFYRAIGQ